MIKSSQVIIGSWSISNLALFGTNLAFFRGGHLGPAAPQFQAVLLGLAALIGVASGALVWAALILCGAVRRNPWTTRTRFLVRACVFVFGVCELGLIFGVAQNQNILQVALLVVLAFGLAWVSVRSIAREPY